MGTDSVGIRVRFRPFARMRVVVVEWLGVGIHWRCLVSLEPGDEDRQAATLMMSARSTSSAECADGPFVNDVGRDGTRAAHRGFRSPLAAAPWLSEKEWVSSGVDVVSGEVRAEARGSENVGETTVDA